MLRLPDENVLLSTPDAEKNILDGFYDPRPRSRFFAPTMVGRRRHHSYIVLFLVDSLPQ